MGLMFEDADKSFLTRDELRDISVFWGIVASDAYAVSCDVIDIIAAGAEPSEIQRHNIREIFAQYMIFSLIHRISQKMDGDRYWAVMLRLLESATWDSEMLDTKVVSDEAPRVFSGLCGTYVGVNNVYIRKAPSMIDCGTFKRMKISWAMQNRGKGLTLSIGDHTIGYAILGADFVNSWLVKCVDVNRDSTRQKIYRTIDSAFNWFYESFMMEFQKNGNNLPTAVAPTTLEKVSKQEKRLRVLKGLLDSGLINQLDYDSRKQVILDTV